MTVAVSRLFNPPPFAISLIGKRGNYKRSQKNEHLGVLRLAYLARARGLWSNTIHAKRPNYGHRPPYRLISLKMACHRFQSPEVLGVGFLAFWALFFCLDHQKGGEKAKY